MSTIDQVLHPTTNMKINTISKKLIKPHTPTPPNLKTYNISFIDKNLGPMNVAVVLFYQSKPQNNSQLEESLSKILVQFYLLAGRYIKDDNLVDCSDQGVEFVVAEAVDNDDDDLELNEVVAKTTYADQINDLLPDNYFRVDEGPTDPLMSIQATHFPCGGLTIGISISHRVFDVSSLATFITAWSNMSNPDHKTLEFITPQSIFDLPLLLPYKYHDFGIPSNKSHINDNTSVIPPPRPRIVVKRVVFNNAALTNLKSKINPKNGKPISRVRVVCAVIAKALIKLDTAKHGRSRDFKIFQPVNMRERTTPSISKHSCGNLSVPSLTRRVEAAEAEEIRVEELYDLIGDAARKSIVDHAQILSSNVDGRDIITNSLTELVKTFTNREMNVVVFTDWSKFGFYEADFGWGKPVWTSIGPQQPGSNSTVFMSNKEGDGIEAWLHLNEEDMSWFDQDEDMKLFTT